MKNDVWLILDLMKSKAKKTKTEKPKKSKKAHKKDLPEGGVWRTIRGAKVYLVNGKVYAGAEGNLSDFDMQEITAIHEARSKKKTTDQVIFEGTKVKVGRERKIGTVIKETPRQYHIQYPDGTVRREYKSKVRRADAYKLKLEEKLAQGGDPVVIKIDGTPEKKQKQKQKKVKEEMGATANPKLDIVMRDIPFTSIKAPLLKRDAQGTPIKEPVLDEDGKQVIDRYTGKPKERYVTYEAEHATEDDLIRDHQGLIISEIVNPYAKRYALDFIQREWRDEFGNPTDLYGDLVQTANIGFLHGLREFAYKVSQGEAPDVDILTHALMRSRQQVSRHAQDLFSDVRIPHRMLAPLSLLSATTERLEKELERTPTVAELAKELKGNPTFNSLKVVAPPEYDPEEGKMRLGREIKDPEEKIEALLRAKKLQRAVNIEGARVAGGNDRGDKTVTLKETLQGDTGSDKTIQHVIAEQEMRKHQRDLRRQLRKVLRNALDDRETELIMRRFGVGTKRRKVKELSDVAKEMGISLSVAKKLSSRAMKKLRNLTPDQLADLKELYMDKSLLGMDTLMKALFINDISHTLQAFGLALSDLDTIPVRKAYGTLNEIQKSLDVPEFVGAVVSVPGTGQVWASVIEYTIPEEFDTLLKSINKRRSDPIQRNKNIKNHVQNSKGKYTQMAKKQRADIERRTKGKDMGGMSWSVRLQYENPGSCWITWNGNKILINGKNGDILFDRANPAHQASAGLSAKEAPTEFSGFKWESDMGQEALREEMDAKLLKFRGNYKVNAKGEVVINPRSKKPQFVGDGWLDNWVEKNKKAFAEAPKNKIRKQFPSGEFLFENPETGKRIVVKVELQNAGTKKAGTAVTYAFDPDSDKRVNIGNWKEIARQLGVELKKGQNAYEVLRNQSNMEGCPLLDVLSEEDYNKLYSQTTAGAREMMVHRKITQVGDGKYQADLGNGRVATFQMDKDGKFLDPVMQSLIQPRQPIYNANDLYTALKNAIGNEAWVTLTPKATHELAHHVRLKYDGQGAPVVVGGAFDGFRFQDAYEVQDPDEKARSLFRGGRLIRTTRRQTQATNKVPFEVGNDVRVRDPRDHRRWITARLVARRRGNAWTVEYADGTIETFKEKQMRHALTRLNIATDAPVIDVATNDMLNLSVPKAQQADFEANYGVTLDEEGRAVISPAQFLELRDKIGTFSFTSQVTPVIEDLYAQQYRKGLPDIAKLQKKYDPNKIDGFKKDSFLRTTNFYNTQVEGIEHLITAKRGIAGHGMGTGKTLIGVGTAMYLRDQALKAGKTPGKTLIVSPAGIQSEWLKEINRHTDVGAVVIGGVTNHGTKMGPPGLESKVIGAERFRGMGDEHFAVISYQQFMENPEKYTKHFENLIIDEVHAFKTKGGNRNKTLKEIANTFENVWGLSGTPMDNQVTDIYYLVDAITGGRHDLGSESEFNQKYLYKQGNKILGMNADMLDELGEKLSKYTQFRDGYADTINYIDPDTGELQTVSFPKVQGNPNRYHGQVEYVTEFDRMVTEDGREVSVPYPKTKLEREFYEEYQRLEAESLSPDQRQALHDAEKSGTETTQNYLQGVQALQQFCNAPLSQKAYYTTKTVGKGKKAVTVKEHKYTIDDQGYRRYWESDGKGGYKKNADGSPKLLPPMHHNNPKAMFLKKIILDHLHEHEVEMERRVKHNKALKPGQKPLPTYAPKIVVTTKYNDFGAEVIANVFRDIKRDMGLDFGMFTGDSSYDRETAKVRFQSDDRMNFLVISDAGKEGIDLGNAHMLVHYDQDFNPNKMAQKSARELRVDSHKHAQREKRPNDVKLKSVVLPGTIEESLIQIQNRKMRDIERVEHSARRTEGVVNEEPYARTTMRTSSWVERTKKSIPLVTTRIRRK